MRLLESGQVTGYAFCVYEETKAVIGDVFALPGTNPDLPAPPDGVPPPAREIEETLLRHLFETLLNSPQVDRIESQLLLHPSGTHAAIFSEAGFELFHRLFMVQPLNGHWTRPRLDLPHASGTAPLARRGSQLRRPPHLRRLSQPPRQPHQRPVPLRARLAALPAQHRPLRRMRRLLRARLARRGRARQPRARSPRAGLARQPAERPHHPALRASRLPAPGNGPPAALRGRHRSSCARASAKSPSPSPKPTPTPSSSTRQKATTARTPSTPPSGSATFQDSKKKFHRSRGQIQFSID